MRATTMCVLALLGLFVGCASGDPNKPPATAAQQRETPSASGDGETAASPPPPADAGTAAGHGADRLRVVVPAKDGTPPSAAVVLADASNGRTLGETAQPGGTHSPMVELSQ